MARITDGLLNAKADRAINRSRQKLIDNQEQGITGKRINKPSDDPQATVRLMGLKVQESRNEQILKNMEMATSFLSTTDGALQELSSVLVRAKELAVQMASASNSSEDAQLAVAAEIEQIFMQAVQLGNARVGERYLFGGYNSDRPPFDTDGNFFGDDGIIELEVQPGQNLVVNMSGVEPFFGIKEVPAQYNEKRQNGDVTAPAISSMRSPASVVAENQGVDLQDDPEAYAQIQAQTKGVNVFSVLSGFADGLRKGDMVQIQSVLEQLDTAHSQVLAARTAIGARQNGVLLNVNLLDSQNVNSRTLISNVEDADSVQTFSELARNETMLQSTLQANKKLLTPSLLEFLK